MLSFASSARALGSLTRDFTNLACRKQRPQILFYRQRVFSTRARVRQVESISITERVEDGIVPFEFEGDGIGSLDSAEGVKERRQRRTEDLDEEWHAEIEIDSASLKGMSSGSGDVIVNMENADDKLVGTGGHSSIATPTEPASSTVDEVSLQNLHLPLTSVKTDDAIPPLVSGEQSVKAQKPRDKPRLERKRRRQEAGTYAKTRTLTKASGEEVEVEKGLESILDQFEAFDDGSDAVEKHEQKSESQQARGVKRGTDMRGQTLKKGARSRSDIVAVKPSKGVAQSKPARKRREIESKDMPSKAETENGPRSSSTQKKETWKVQKQALVQKFGEHSWQPRKKVSPDTMQGIRALHASDPQSYSTQTLSEHFEISAEAVRRILKSKWQPSPEEIEKRRERWEKRGVKKWTEMAGLGVRPPAKWRAMGVKQPGEGRKRERKRKGDGYVEWDNGRAEEVHGSFSARIL